MLRGRNPASLHPAKLQIRVKLSLVDWQAINFIDAASMLKQVLWSREMRMHEISRPFATERVKSLQLSSCLAYTQIQILVAELHLKVLKTAYGGSSSI